MFVPARIGDTVTHDLLVPCGAIAPPPSGQPITVIIEGLPAAFVGCTVVCTGLTAAGPAHPPPPGPMPVIVGGAATVVIQGAPAARWSPAPDVGACGAMLGDPKLLATRTVKMG